MITCIFTLDYEIYGNGHGSLRELVYEPAEQLRAVFEKWNARFVAFVETAELELIEARRTDEAIGSVRTQVHDLYERGFELGLHIHPQWYNAHYESGRWLLDSSEYNLCTLPRDRIAEIVDRAIGFLLSLSGSAEGTPVCFRAGNWLFQPSQAISRVLAERGIQIDSSVFKGGLQRQHCLDYRRSMRNGYFWPFSEDVEVPDVRGRLWEFPIYTKMVPAWQFLTAKRVGLQRKGPSPLQGQGERIRRNRDFLRWRYPLKFDFCRMTMRELVPVLDEEIEKAAADSDAFRPIVAIGHTKELIDLETVDSLLSYLRKKNVPIKTFKDVIGCLAVRKDVLTNKGQTHG
jgi:hypothetical protein